MYSIYQLYCMNGMKTPFTIKQTRWGNLEITVDHVDNFHYSAGGWRCDAYTKSEDYMSSSYGTANRADVKMKVIGGGGSYKWQFVDQPHNEELIKPYREYDRPKSVKGVTVQKAGKKYICGFCKSDIPKGDQYERYNVRHARKLGAIKEVFCVGCRDKLREKHFGKPANEIKYGEILDAWDNGILV
ncbi:MAG: hypothetical protein VYA60_05025 [Pseudomonadota bacterium]|nr:hypothetical protein [Pseudomonadota bacterium]